MHHPRPIERVPSRVVVAAAERGLVKLEWSEIGRRAGVSATTAAHVLTGSRRMSTATTAKVLGALGLEPDAA